jgi:transcription elongation factor Elf1
MKTYWRWRLHVQYFVQPDDETQIIYSTRERRIPLMIVCKRCNNEHVYTARVGWHYNRCNCPNCGLTGVIL